MCTAISFRKNGNYFGRNLDVFTSFGESVVIAPENFILNFRFTKSIKNHSAIIGMAVVENNSPLYFEATNKDGLSVAGLNFPENAYYAPYCENKINICPFELIPFILGSCKTCDEAQKIFENINIVNEPFSDKLPLTPLHWLISDRHRSITLECVKEGIKVYENPVEVLTNNPPFHYHLTNLNNYMALHEGVAQNLFGFENAKNYSLGFGALGLPGDFSSASRFVKAVFVKEKAVAFKGEENVTQFFHILSAVAMPKGCVKNEKGELEYTSYSCCIDIDKGVYYYRLYEKDNTFKVDINKQNLKGTSLYIYKQN